MATLPKSTATAQLGTSAAAVLTAPAGVTYVVTKISLHNSDTSTVTGIGLTSTKAAVLRARPM